MRAGPRRASCARSRASMPVPRLGGRLRAAVKWWCPACSGLSSSPMRQSCLFRVAGHTRGSTIERQFPQSSPPSPPPPPPAPRAGQSPSAPLSQRRLALAPLWLFPGFSRHIPPAPARRALASFSLSSLLPPSSHFASHLRTTHRAPLSTHRPPPCPRLARDRKQKQKQKGGISAPGTRHRQIPLQAQTSPSVPLQPAAIRPYERAPVSLHLSSKSYLIVLPLPHAVTPPIPRALSLYCHAPSIWPPALVDDLDVGLFCPLATRPPWGPHAHPRPLTPVSVSLAHPRLSPPPQGF